MYLYLYVHAYTYVYLSLHTPNIKVQKSISSLSHPSFVHRSDVSHSHPSRLGFEAARPLLVSHHSGHVMVEQLRSYHGAHAGMWLIFRPYLNWLSSCQFPI